MLELTDVSKQVGAETHIDSVSLRLEGGTLNVLLGPTLSGKTTLMRIMAGLDKPTSGSVYMDGEDVTGITVRKRDVAMVYQQFINYPSLTVYENIASPLRVAGTKPAEIDQKVRSAAELLKLTPYMDRHPLELSGGQQQRTALARALVKGARLVLMDEPLANLDYKLREELRAELPKVFAESGAIFVYATTEPAEALLLGGNTATLHHGKVSQFGPTLDVYRNPVNLQTARTFSDPPLNTLSIAKRGSSFDLGESTSVPVASNQQALADGTYTAGIRPHHLWLDRPNGEFVEVTGTVVVCEITGSESFVHVDVLGQRWVALTHGVRNLDAGSSVPVYLRSSDFLLFDEHGQRASALMEAA
ncbi:ABC transporter ATP-binding protein [Rhodobacteraceae bacterium RKSG542]|uniref:ABC transporter ATP-binding protein n=1 Tax=Pseudovibrio flavus TaxID=2529854 RepID=UPI0012BC6F91|nr:ABC transporter ATP-binding protein [Pseudovibrio flavus]MTI18212.1 ABC transporter ATP-binding protein [Pseudovibrio flavus]